MIHVDFNSSMILPTTHFIPVSSDISSCKYDIIILSQNQAKIHPSQRSSIISVKV